MEHRYEQRLPCRLDVELYCKDLHLGTAEVTNISKNGVNVCTGVVLRNNKSNCADLIFDEPIYTNLPDLQHVCDESGCREESQADAGRPCTAPPYWNLKPTP